MSKPSLSTLASLFFRVGNQTFGSGSTTVILLSREMDERRWLERWQCDLYYALARVVPGTNVLAFVAGAAYAIRGWAGVGAALLAYTIPASAVVVALTIAYGRWHTHPVGGEVVGSAMSAIAGIIAGAAFLLAAPRFRKGERLRTASLVCGGLLLSTMVSPLTVIALAAVAGWFWPDGKGS